MSSGPSRALSDAQARTQLTTQADQICRRLNAELKALKPRHQTQEEVGRIVALSVTAERRAVRALDGLPAPASLAQSWHDIRSSRRALANQLARYGRLVEQRSTDTSAINVLGASKRRLHETLRKAARESGFHDCGKVGF